MGRSILTARGVESLSPRRRELLELVAKGLTNDEIATIMGITPGTVRAHVTALLAQLDVSNRTEAAALFVSWEARPVQVDAVLQRPAIAVLPMVPIGDDPQLRTVAAGLTEDLASLFSRWCWFPVISTMSSANARHLGTTLREVAGQLRARFLVNGSVRHTGDKWRLSVHIDDAHTEQRLWSEQRDLPWESLACLQDEFCRHIVAAAYPALVARLQVRLRDDQPMTQLATWELAHRGMALQATRQREANAQATAHFLEALRREPDFLLAHFGLGLVSYDAVLNQWGPTAEAHDTMARAVEACLTLAPHAAEGHYLLGRLLQTRAEWEAALQPLETAIGYNPSFAMAHATLAQALHITGRLDESLVRMKHAERLGPRSFAASIATLHFMRGEYAEAVAASESVIATNPHYPFLCAIAAVSYSSMGDEQRGRTQARTLRERHPQFHPNQFARTFGTHVEAVDRLTRGLGKLLRSL